MSKARALVCVPKLAELLERPELVSIVSPAVAGSLLAQIAPLQTALLARCIGGLGRQAEPDRLVSVQEAAARLGVSRGWIYNHKATLPFVRPIGNALRCPEAGITAWLSQKQPSGHCEFR